MIHQTNYNLGNKVAHKDFPNEIMEIVAIDKFNPTMYLTDEDGYRFDATTDEIIPISLNSEWLGRMGMHKRFDNADCNIWDMENPSTRNKAFCLALLEKGWVYPTAPGAVPFFYLHQLQNLYFALTGEYLKIFDL